ncbi:hypothetical protein LSAT2_008242 [Lamellibrachia satsuma]|nr:hypothetical protein LSAT2_008242 [Lamellibrachia satsuma]
MASDRRDMNDKLGKLSPDLQEIFVATIEQMLRQETTSMLHFLRESRADMNAAVRMMQHGQRALKSAQVDAVERPPVISANRHVTRDARPVSSFSVISARSVMTPSSIDLGDMADYDEDDRSVRGATVSHETGPPEIPCFYREMTKDMIERLASATARIERERQRQAELARERRDTKKARKMEEVARLFELADTSVVEKEKTRQKQGEKLRQKIREMRNSRTETSEM